MVRIVAKGADVVVCLTWRERLAARRWEVRVPASTVRRLRLEPDWWRALRGVRGKGTWWPGGLCAGLRCVENAWDFAVVRPGGPVLCIELAEDAPFRRLAVSVPDPHEAVRRLQTQALLR
ncbi:hypothetical protein ACWD6P_20690 [Streptomyces sp. NPDC002446]